MVQGTDIISISIVEASVQAEFLKQGEQKVNIFLWKRRAATESVMESEQCIKDMDQRLSLQ